MSDIILARVSETLATEQSLESLVRQLLEMLEIVTEMESTYLTKVDINARLQHILYARNSKQMQIPEGLSVPWGDTLCKRAIESGTLFSNEVAERWPDCDAAKAPWHYNLHEYPYSPLRMVHSMARSAPPARKRNIPVTAVNSSEIICRLIAQYIQKESLVIQLREAKCGTHCALLYRCPYRITKPPRHLRRADDPVFTGKAP